MFLNLWTGTNCANMLTQHVSAVWYEWNVGQKMICQTRSINTRKMFAKMLVKQSDWHKMLVTPSWITTYGIPKSPEEKLLIVWSNLNHFLIYQHAATCCNWPDGEANLKVCVIVLLLQLVNLLVREVFLASL